MNTAGQKSLPYYVTSLAVVGFLCLWFAYRILSSMTTIYKQESLSQHLVMAKTTAHQFEEELRNNLKLLKTCTSRPEMRQLIERGQWEAAVNLTQDSLASGGTFAAIQLFNPAGKLTAEFPPSTLSSPRQSDGNEAWYSSFSKSWTPIIWKVQLRERSPRVWVFLEIMPVFSNDGRRLGIFTVQVPIARILSKIESLTPDFTGSCYLINKQGESLIDENASNTDGNLPKAAEQTSLTKAVLSADSGTVEYVDKSRKTRYLSAFALIPEIGASLVRETPSENALSSLRLFLIVMGSFACLIILITGRFFWAWNDLIKKQVMSAKMEEFEQLKGNFLTVASHELKTPLTSLREGVALLHDEPAENLTEIQQSLIAIIDRNTQRLFNLVNDIVDISIMEAGKTLFKRDRIDVRSFLAGAVDSIRTEAETKNITVNMVACDPPPAFGDLQRLHQMLVSLLRNSIKHTPENGRVDISTNVRGTDIQICVADTGKGIPKDTQKHLFEKLRHFVPSNPEEGAQGAPGTELSLAVCKHIVNANDGEINVESKPGEGTKIFFTLPHFSVRLWWTSTWNELKTQDPASGVGLIGVKIIPKISTALGGFETRIRNCVKKRDYVLCDAEAGIVWVLACARDFEVERITSRIHSSLEAHVAENGLGQQIHFHIAWEHHLQGKVADPMVPTATLSKRLNEKSMAA